MARIQSRGETVRTFIISRVEAHPKDIAKLAAERFGISRQAVNKHLQRLVAEKALVAAGTTRSREYRLAPLVEHTKAYELNEALAEDIIWRSDIEPSLGQLPENAMGIWQYGFTEMMNNAIDHSVGTEVTVSIRKTAAMTELFVIDNGIGIFKKIKTELGLLDERHALLELAKGKLTTDPSRHTGEGIFFSSRMFDDFAILSGNVHFSHKFGDDDDWIMECPRPASGTTVWMKLGNHTARTQKKVFKQFTSGEDFGFSKTVVPVRLAQYGNDKLISRSQAKRLLARVDKFKTVMFDFSGVESIGQAFADEVFRVFPRQHPTTEVFEIKANSTVRRMIQRARTTA